MNIGLIMLFNILLIAVYNVKADDNIANDKNTRAVHSTKYENIPLVIRGDVTSHGRALSNAVVQIVISSFRGMVKVVKEIKTDKNGEFEAEYYKLHDYSFDNPRYYKLVIIYPGYVRYVSEWISKSAPVVTQFIEMHKGVEIDGFVVDSDGKPVENVSIRVEKPAFLSTGFLHTWNENSVAVPKSIETNKKGYFKFKEHLEGAIIVSAFAPDHASMKQLHVFERSFFRPKSTLTIKLNNGNTVSGKVYIDGNPTGKIILTWRCEQHHYTFSQLSQNNGSYILKNIHDGENCKVIAYPSNSSALNFITSSRASKNNAAQIEFIPTSVKAQIGDTDVKLFIKSVEPGSALISFDGRYLKSSPLTI